MEKILLFIPMYNCEKQIVRVLGQLDEELCANIAEVLIVNNRSTDDGEEAVIRYASQHTYIPLKLLRNDENYGGGGSHKVAFNYAIDNGFDYVIVLHGDDQGSIRDLWRYIETKEAFQYDAFLGSRFEKDSRLVNYSKFRIFGNHVFNAFMTVALKHRVTDLGAGLNMYSTKFLANRFYMKFINSLTFYVYLLIYIMHSECKYTFFPLTWREDDQISNAKFFRQSKEILGVTFKYLNNPEKMFNNDKNEFSMIKYKSEVVYEQH